VPRVHTVAPPDDVARKRAIRAAYTLFELAIVLVIIGLIIGSVLVGRDLISSATIRSQLSQFEQLNAAVNTFLGKYGGLPGDLNASLASQFGFASRNGTTGNGNGDGLIQGSGGWAILQQGEPYMFWQDLASSNLLPGSSGGCFGPAGKIPGNCFFVYSGGVQGGNGLNYYNLSVPVNLNGYGRCSWCLASNPGLTVAQAYNIDLKIDDGLPQSGNVKSLYLSCNDQGAYAVAWAGVGIVQEGGVPASSDSGYTTATAGSSTTCFDNGNTAGAIQHYSMAQKNGAGMNCALSFRFQ
jgi:hypothetical protein